MVRKIAVTILALAYLLVSTELHEVLRVPQLIFHYTHHVSGEPELGFLDFIQEHYSHRGKSSNEHENLPFSDSDLHIVPLVSDRWHPEVHQLKYAAIPVASLIPYRVPHTGAGARADIWQPPRA